ncbi:hypothetical protein DPV78_007079 [Talaromyces pinophilus]|nr:hypothetical protein DPV78_007079 [Talaromyces pinophilus]
MSIYLSDAIRAKSVRTQPGLKEVNECEKAAAFPDFSDGAYSEEFPPPSPPIVPSPSSQISSQISQSPVMTDAEWGPFKLEIERLYCHENKSLLEVVQYMASAYAFEKS